MDLLAERLTKRRQALKIQKKMVADRIGMTPQAYNHYEAGTRQPSYPVILLLSLALETSVSYLTGQSDDPAPDRILLKINEADDIADFISAYRHLPPDAKKLVKDLIKNLRQG